jgi:3'-phosphoadenosine 5'-phosphosulfate sulfotransferase (PAPS reductase)/FAD synthetase
MCKQFGWNLSTVHPKEGEEFEDFVRKFGFPKQGAHNMVMGYLKWHPMRKWAREHRDEQFAFCSGRRSTESKRRARIMGKTIIQETEKMTFVAPLYHWTDEDVWGYIRENNLVRCPVYETMEMSGDCFCGSMSEIGEMFLINVFHKTLYEFLLGLEEKYGHQWAAKGRGSWGNGVSARGVINQTQMEGWACNECSTGLRVR